MKIGLYFPNVGISNIDLSIPHLSNPGIGGTQYCFLLLGYYLLEYYSEEIEITYYSNIKCNLFKNAQNEIVDGLLHTIHLSAVNKNDFLIIPQLNYGEYLLMQEVEHPIIVWAHNYILNDDANLIASLSCIKSVVFVGRQQYDRYIDHDIIKKSTYIYNMLNDTIGDIIPDAKSKTVVYMGALIPSKGFHLLAKIWKDILEECPTAKLQVIGGGCLYSRNSLLGVHGYAEQSYEEHFLSYLTDCNGEILPSVDFLGILGNEKYQFFQKAAVGVLNPSARTETFGMGIVEMAFCKLPVVTLGKNGFLDTVLNGQTGILGKNLNDIKNAIIYLLNTPEKRLLMGKSAKSFADNFSPLKITKVWMGLFRILRDNNELPYIYPETAFYNNFKWLRICNRIVRFNMGLHFVPSVLALETIVFKLIKRVAVYAK